MPARVKAINLLPPSDFELSFWGRFLKWAVTAGRYIIIVTEMIVIMAFLSRFKLDKDLADLAANLQGQKSVLEAQEEVEREFRDVQARLEMADQILAIRPTTIEEMDKLIQKLSPEVKLSEWTIERGKMSVQAEIYSEVAAGKLISRLVEDPDIKSVEVTDFDADISSGIKLGLSIKL